jgi:hypothetical protein
VAEDVEGIEKCEGFKGGAHGKHVLAGKDAEIIRKLQNILIQDIVD